ncbi:hypothetical protein JTB14_000060 [Gonioctena quinquepunctata]|nr:hypothetical protein JTB14_000060 [Gonioctena quinquepunctata]
MIIFKGKRSKPEFLDNLPPGSIVRMVPKLSSQQHIIKKKSVELEELAPDAQAEQQSGDGNINKSFTQLLPTPTMKLKPKSNRREALNYKAQAVIKDLFNPQPSTSWLATTKQTREKGESSKKSESWFCNVCETEVQLDMRQCAQCGIWVHESCVGLTAEDVEDFICSECD